MISEQKPTHQKDIKIKTTHMESSEDKYDIPYTYRKHFSPEACTELVKTFKNYDKNGDCKMDKNEFKGALKDMGHDEVSDE